MAIWASSGSFCSATLAAPRTPAQASARPYAAPPSTSTGIRIAAGTDWVNTAARITGVTATPTPSRVRSCDPAASPLCPLAALGMGVPPRFSTG